MCCTGIAEMIGIAETAVGIVDFMAGPGVVVRGGGTRA